MFEIYWPLALWQSDQSLKGYVISQSMVRPFQLCRTESLFRFVLDICIALYQNEDRYSCLTHISLTEEFKLRQQHIRKGWEKPLRKYVKLLQGAGYSFWDRLRKFLHKFTWIVLSVHKLNKVVKYQAKLWLIWKKITMIS